MKKFIYIILSTISIFVISCKMEPKMSVNTKITKLLQDTANNDRAKWDLEQLEHYNNICKVIGLNKLEDGSDSLEVRIWKQFSVFGMATDEEIYCIKIIDSTYMLSFYRVYCTHETYDENGNYNKWNAFKDPKLDSFKAISKTVHADKFKDIDLNKIWNIKSQSELKISDSIGFTDGTVTSIEIANKSKYKLIRHHVAHSYYRVTKNIEIKKYMDMRDKILLYFFQNRVYDLMN